MVDALVCFRYTEHPSELLGQQSLAHMALVFALLVAVFTFATGFDKKLSRLRAIVSYLGVVLLLLTVAAYAVGRSVFYGALAWKAILTDPTLCPAASPITLAKYVSCINSAYYPSDPLVRWILEPVLSNYRNFAGFGILISVFLALLGTVAIFVIARSPERSSQNQSVDITRLSKEDGPRGLPSEVPQPPGSPELLNVPKKPMC